MTSIIKRNIQIVITLTVLIISLMIGTNAAYAENAIDDSISWDPYSLTKDEPMIKNEDFEDKVDETVPNGGATYALKPGKPEYRYKIAGSATGHIVNGQGKIMSDENVSKFNKGQNSYTISKSDEFIFDLENSKAGGIVVDYPGLEVLDSETGYLEYMTLRVEVKRYNHKPYKNFDFMKRATLVMNKTIAEGKGLPNLRIINVGTIQIKYTFLRTGVENSRVKVRTSFTYGDIDNLQAVSGYDFDEDLKMASKTCILKYAWGGDEDKWLVYSSPTKLDAEGSTEGATAAKAGFYIDSTTFTVRLTSNQTTDDHKASGNYSYFAISTEGEMPTGRPIELKEQQKYVTDGDTYINGKFNPDTNDIIDPNENEKNLNHDVIEKKYDDIFYTIPVEIPENMNKLSEKSRFNKLEFTDEFDQCLQYRSCEVYIAKKTNYNRSVFEQTPVNLDAYKDIVRANDNFKISEKDNILTVSLNTSNYDDKLLYDNNVGSYLILRVTARIKSSLSLTDLKRAKHQWQGGTVEHYTDGHVDIPNRISMYASVNSKDVTPINNRKSQIVNTRIKVPDGKITVHKTDENGDAIQSSKTEFGLFQGDYLAASKWTDETGTVVFEDLEYDTYTIRELTPPKGYIATTSTPSIKLTNTDKEKEATIKDKPTEVKILKVDDLNNPVSGAVLQIFDERGTAVCNQWTTDGKPHIVNFLDVGETYILRELTVPPGGTHIKAEDVEFQIPDSGTKTVTMVDPRNQLEVYIRKIDFLTSQRLGGVKLELYQGDFPGTTPITGPLIDSWTSSSTSDQHEVLIPNTTYTVVEREYPLGYGAPNGAGGTDVNGRRVFTTRNYGSEVETIIVENSPIPLNVEIRKVDENGEPLYGATFELYDSTGTRIDTWTTSASTDPHDISDIVIRGEEYTIKEISAPARYKLAADQKFTVNNHGTQTITIENTKEDPVPIYVAKIDAETGRLIGGAKLAVYAGTITSASDIENHNMIGEPWTSVEGEEHEVPGLIRNNSYTVVELKSPDKYLPAEFSYFTVTGATHQTIRVYDPPNKKEVRIIKTNSDTSNVVPEAGLALYKGSFPGAGITEDLKEETPIRSWTSGTSYETFTLDDIRIGEEYTLVETSRPKGYLQADNIVFTVNNNTVQIIEMKDDPFDMEWRFNKIDAATNNRIGGALFALYRGSYPGNTELPTSALKRWYSEAGKDYVVTDDDIEVGEYYTFVELAPPEGYAPALEPRQIFKAENKIPNIYSFVNAESNNKPVYIWKVDEQNRPLSGAGMALYINNHATGSLPSTDLIGQPWTSDSNKAYKASLIKGQTYTIVETETPTGYQPENGVTRKVFTVGDNTSAETIRFKNVPIEKHIYVEKKALDTGLPLPGAQLALYRGSYPGSFKDIPEGTNPVMEPWISGTEPYEITSYIENDSADQEYTIVELNEPFPYTKAPNTIFRKNNEAVQTITVYDPKDKKSIYIEKVDSVSGAPVEGAWLRLYPGRHEGSGDPSDFSDLPSSFVDNWITDGTVHEIQNAVSVGMEYTLVEMEAPEKYRLANRVIFTVTDQEKQTVVMEDDPVNKMLYIDKIDADTKKPISGARLKLYLNEYPGANAELLDTWTSDKNNMHEYIDEHNKLKEGVKCTLVEEEAPQTPKKYLVSDNVVFTINGDLKQYVTMEDEPFVHNTYIEKVDEDTGEYVPGAALSLYDMETGRCIDSWTSGERSAHKVKEELIPGKQYKVVETEAPAGYAKFNDYVFTADNNTVQTVTVNNTKITKDIIIEKRDSEDDTFVEGAQMKLYRGSYSGQQALNDDDIVDEWTTGQSGRVYTASAAENIASRQLRIGNSYTIVETRAPSGYETAARKVFKIENNTDTQTIVVQDKREGKPKLVKIEKVDSETGNRIGGAVLRLYRGEFEDGDNLPDNAIEDEWTSSATAPQTYYNTLTVNQKYTVVEVSSPRGYQKASNVIFKVDDSSVQLITVEDVPDSVPPEVIVEKVDSETGLKIAGAKLRLYEGEYPEDRYPEDTDIPSDMLKYRWTSRSDSGYTFTSPTIERGKKYTVVETDAPEGYQKAKRVIFTVDKKAATQTITVSDPPENTYFITIRKTDTVNPLKWATFEVRADDPATGSLVGKPKTVTSDDGKVTFDSIRASATDTPRTYYIVETAAPAGYKKSGPYGFKVDRNGNFTDLSGRSYCITNTEDNTSIPLNKAGYYDIVNIEPEATLKLVKTNEDKTAYLKGAQFKLKGKLAKDDSQISPKYSGITGDNGRTEIAGIKPGTYILEETLFPKGYSPIMRRYQVIVDSNGLLVMKNIVTGDLISDIEDGRYVIRNKLGLTKDIHLIKYGKDNKPLANVKFLFTGTTTDGETIQPLEVESDDSGAVDIFNVKAGTYTLTETELPPGYLEKRTWTITVKTEP